MAKVWSHFWNVTDTDIWKNKTSGGARLYAKQKRQMFIPIVVIFQWVIILPVYPSFWIWLVFPTVRPFCILRYSLALVAFEYYPQRCLHLNSVEIPQSFNACVDQNILLWHLRKYNSLEFLNLIFRMYLQTTPDCPVSYYTSMSHNSTILNAGHWKIPTFCHGEQENSEPPWKPEVFCLSSLMRAMWCLQEVSQVRGLECSDSLCETACIWPTLFFAFTRGYGMRLEENLTGISFKTSGVHISMMHNGSQNCWRTISAWTNFSIFNLFIFIAIFDATHALHHTEGNLFRFSKGINAF